LRSQRPDRDGGTDSRGRRSLGSLQKAITPKYSRGSAGGSRNEEYRWFVILTGEPWKLRGQRARSDVRWFVILTGEPWKLRGQSALEAMCDDWQYGILDTLFRQE
jgi:hypothetical protein